MIYGIVHDNRCNNFCMSFFSHEHPHHLLLVHALVLVVVVVVVVLVLALVNLRHPEHP